MTSNPSRIFYFDVLRAVAILCVVLLHVTGHLAEMMNYNIVTIYSASGIFETFANNFFRIGIALFMMLSGALLLGRKWDVKEFYIKRFTRISKPFLFWALIFSIVLMLASYFISGVSFVKHFSAIDFVTLFFQTLACKAPGSAVYWFFWMLVGVYLVMPLLNRWINGTDFSKIEYFLIIWAIYIIAVHSFMIPVPWILSFLISPIGFAVLGYYLRYTERKIFNNSLIAWILIIVPAILMLLYSYSIVNSTILFVFDRYSLPVMIEAIGVFCLFKSSSRVNNLPVSFNKIITSIAFCSYGMYLIHSHIIMVVRKVLHISFNFTADYIILFIAGFVMSWAIIYILAKLPLLDDFVGVK